MQYFVTFTLLRSQRPQLFVSGNGTDGRQAVQEQLSFTSHNLLRAKLSDAGLPETLADEDVSSPLLVSAEQLRALGIAMAKSD
jgi:hypothetical protein